MDSMSFTNPLPTTTSSRVLSLRPIPPVERVRQSGGLHRKRGAKNDKEALGIWTFLACYDKNKKNQSNSYNRTWAITETLGIER